jgi:hypothetical protein
MIMDLINALLKLGISIEDIVEKLELEVEHINMEGYEHRNPLPL